MADERLRFIEEVEAGDETVAALCRHYGISRKTGYKWLERYRDEGVAGLLDRSRAPRRQARRVEAATEDAILELRGRYPHWGERKIKAWLDRERPEQGWPAASTIGALLKRRGLTQPPRRRRRATPSLALHSAEWPNQIWSIDFKGWFLTADGRRCDPLTLCDVDSRFLLRCQALERATEAFVRPLLIGAFREYGVPEAIRSDNGPPFASTGLAGLSRLSVWWLRLGIWPERIAPGHPEQNGRHERLHRTLKRETATPPARTGRAQQRAFDGFRREYNSERPHEALSMATPASRYRRSARQYPERLTELEYPAGLELRRVEAHGDVSFRARRFFLSETLAGEVVALEELEQGWQVWFGPLELGLLERRAVERPGRRSARLALLRP